MNDTLFKEIIGSAVACVILYFAIKGAIRLYFEEKRRHTKQLIKDITKGDEK